MSPETQIEGRLDAVENNKVFGWAWDRARPGERAVVELRCGGAVLASVTADRERSDLLANGIGDGVHAFEAELEAPPAGPVEAYIRLPDGSFTPLSRRSEVEIAAESAIAPGLRRLLDALEGLGERQRDLMAGQMAIARMLRANAQGQAAAAPVDTEKAEALLGQISDRLDVFETFLMRFDERLRQLEETGSPRPEPEQPAKRRFFPRLVRTS